MADLKITRYDGNEIADSNDINHGETQDIENINALLENIYFASKDVIIQGLTVEEIGVPAMNVQVLAGMAFCQSTGKMARHGSTSSSIAIAAADPTNPRVDVLECRVVATNFDSQQRAYRNPTTGDITYQAWDTKARYEIEFQVLTGTPSVSPSAPTQTTGWIKLAEINVAALATTILDANINNVTAGYDGESNSAWTTEDTVTFKIYDDATRGGVPGIKYLMRQNHDEDGDHKDDSIKDNHIDWGTGAGQVSATDLVILDAGNRYTGVEVETALQEIAGASRTTETVKGNADDLATLETDLASTATNKGASLIGVEDSDDNFVGTDVEAALSEVGSVARYKLTTLDATAIGTPLGIPDGTTNVRTSVYKQIKSEFKFYTNSHQYHPKSCNSSASGDILLISYRDRTTNDLYVAAYSYDEAGTLTLEDTATVSTTPQFAETGIVDIGNGYFAVAFTETSVEKIRIGLYSGGSLTWPHSTEDPAIISGNAAHSDVIQLTGYTFLMWSAEQGTGTDIYCRVGTFDGVSSITWNTATTKINTNVQSGAESVPGVLIEDISGNKAFTFVWTRNSNKEATMRTGRYNSSGGSIVWATAETTLTSGHTVGLSLKSLLHVGNNNLVIVATDIDNSGDPTYMSIFFTGSGYTTIKDETSLGLTYGYFTENAAYLGGDFIAVPEMNSLVASWIHIFKFSEGGTLKHISKTSITSSYSSLNSNWVFYLKKGRFIINYSTITPDYDDYLQIYLFVPYLGMALQAVSANNSLYITSTGVVSGFTGLIPGAVYFIDLPNSSVYRGDATYENIKVGKAISTTQIALQS